jgi:hypothetical protein
MAWSQEDEELRRVPQRPEDYAKADKGRREALRRALREEKGKEIEAQKTQLLSEVELQRLRADVAGKKDEETKRRKRTEEQQKRKEIFGTKTHKELEEKAVMTATVQMDAERLITEEKKEEEEQRQAGQEYQKDAG